MLCRPWGILVWERCWQRGCK